LIVVSCLVFLFSLLVSFFLLDSISLFDFCIKNKRKIFFSAIVYILPKIFFLQSIPFILDVGLCITIITDLIEYSVFSIVPAILILYSFLIALYSGCYTMIIYSIIYTILIYVVFIFLELLIKRFFGKVGLGLGDLYFYFVFAWFFDLYFLFLSFFVASLLGLFFILFYKLIFFRRPLKKIIPFIPFLYLSISILQIKKFFIYVSCFLSM
jgi:hypothetical protein